MKCFGVFRKVRGIDQTVLAERAGISRRTLNDHETGRTFPTRRVAKDIDDAFFEVLMERLREAVRTARDASRERPLPAGRRYDRLDEKMGRPPLAREEPPEKAPEDQEPGEGEHQGDATPQD